MQFSQTQFEYHSLNFGGYGSCAVVTVDCCQCQCRQHDITRFPPDRRQSPRNEPKQRHSQRLLISSSLENPNSSSHRLVLVLAWMFQLNFFFFPMCSPPHQHIARRSYSMLHVRSVKLWADVDVARRRAFAIVVLEKFHQFLSNLHLNELAFIRKFAKKFPPFNLISRISINMTILLCLLVESILYFWFLFLAIDLFEVIDLWSRAGWYRTVPMTSSLSQLCLLFFPIFSVNKSRLRSDYQLRSRVRRSKCRKIREFRELTKADLNFNFLTVQQATYIFNSHQRHNRSSSSAYSTTGLLRNLARLPYDPFRNDHVFLLNNLRREW